MITNIYVLMSKFNWTLNEVLELPYSAFNVICEEVVRENKELERKSKKSKR